MTGLKQLNDGRWSANDGEFQEIFANITSATIWLHEESLHIDEDFRPCQTCNGHTAQGFVIETAEYDDCYCSFDCMEKDGITEKDYNERVSNDEAYYTVWADL